MNLLKNLCVYLVLFTLFSINSFAGDWVTDNPDIYYSEGKVGINTNNPREQLQIGTTRPITFHDGGKKAIAFNAYYNDGWKFVTGNAFASMLYYDSNNIFTIKTSNNSGDADSAISWNYGISLDTNGTFIVPGSARFQTNTDPFIISRGSNTNQEMRFSVEDTVAILHYINDEDLSRINFRLQNTDTESGGGANANDKVVMSVFGDKNGGGVEIKGSLKLSAVNMVSTYSGRSFLMRSDNFWYIAPNGADTNHNILKVGGVSEEGKNLQFRTTSSTYLAVDNGSVSIGNTNPGAYKLNVSGSIRADEIVVNTTGADYVFEKNYKLEPLDKVAEYIEKEKHLPDIPSAAEMKEKGIGISEMQTKLLAKIEELTLYMIEMKKESTKMNDKYSKLEKENQELKEMNQSILAHLETLGDKIN